MRSTTRALLPLAFALPGWAQVTVRASLATSGAEAHDSSFSPSVSATGRWVAFASVAGDLLPGQAGVGISDVFVADLANGALERVSRGPSGTGGDGPSTRPSITPDGRFVVFESEASDLVPNDTNSAADVFVRDRLSGSLERVSVGPGAVEGDDDSRFASITPDGRFVVFEGWGTTFAAGDTNQAIDIYVRDRQLGLTERVSLSSSGGQSSLGEDNTAPAISDDGRFVVYESESDDLVPGDTNGKDDVFVTDRATGATVRISLGPGGVQGTAFSNGPVISGDGRFVAFQSRAAELIPGDTNAKTDVLVHDRINGTLERASLSDGAGLQGNDHSTAPRISADGRFVVFASLATNLTVDPNAQPDVFVRDRAAGRTWRVSASAIGSSGNGASFDGSISSTGRFVAFASSASDLVAGDGNGVEDVFLHDRGDTPVVYCTAKTNSQGCVPAIGANGSPSASGGSGFVVTAASVLNQRSGQLFYGFGRAALPFHGGTLCVQPPKIRTPLQQSGGSSSGTDCSGSFAFDMGARIVSGVDPALIVGATVDAQYYYRDPASPNPLGLTDGLEFAIGP